MDVGMLVHDRRLLLGSFLGVVGRSGWGERIEKVTKIMQDVPTVCMKYRAAFCLSFHFPAQQQAVHDQNGVEVFDCHALPLLPTRECSAFCSTQQLSAIKL